MLQMIAAEEHHAKIRRIGQVKRGQVKGGKTVACQEHLAHTYHGRCIQACDIQVFKIPAPCEHPPHRCHPGSIQASEIDFFQVITVIKHGKTSLRMNGSPKGYTDDAVQIRMPGPLGRIRPGAQASLRAIRRPDQKLSGSIFSNSLSYPTGRSIRTEAAPVL